MKMVIFWTLLVWSLSCMCMLNAQSSANVGNSLTTNTTKNILAVASVNATVNSTEIAARPTTESQHSITSTTLRQAVTSTTPAPKVNQYNQKHKIMLVLMSDVHFKEFGKRQGPSIGNEKPPRVPKKPDGTKPKTTSQSSHLENTTDPSCINTTTTPAPDSDMKCDESHRDDTIVPFFSYKNFKFPEPIACETLSKDEKPSHHSHDLNCYFPSIKALRFKILRQHAKNQRRSHKPQDYFASMRKLRPYLYDYDYMEQYDEGKPWQGYDSREDSYYPYM